jgi:hypothetical protein
MFFDHSPPLCITGNHGRAIFSVMPSVPTPILTGHYACNCISNDVGRCPVSMMPMIPIVFFNRRYTRFLVNFKISNCPSLSLGPLRKYSISFMQSPRQNVNVTVR